MKFLSYLLMCFLIIGSVKAEEKQVNVNINGSFSNWIGYNSLNANSFKVNDVSPSWELNKEDYSSFSTYSDNNLGMNVNVASLISTNLKIKSNNFENVYLKDLYIDVKPLEWFTIRLGNFDSINDEYSIKGYSVGLGDDLSELVNIETDGFYAFNHNDGDFILISPISDSKPDFKSNLESNGNLSIGGYLNIKSGLMLGFVYTPSNVKSGINLLNDERVDQYDAGVNYKNKIHLGVSYIQTSYLDKSKESKKDLAYNFGMSEDYKKLHLSFGVMYKPMSENIVLNDPEYFKEDSVLIKGTAGVGFDLTKNLNMSYTYGFYYKKYDQTDYLTSTDQITAEMKGKVFQAETHELAASYKINEYTSLVTSGFMVRYQDPTVESIIVNDNNITSSINNKSLIENQYGVSVGLKVKFTDLNL